MSPLDEDLLNKITYSPECQATFRKYKSKMIKEIITTHRLFFLFILVMVLLGIYLSMSIDFNNHRQQDAIPMTALSVLIVFGASFFIVLLAVLPHELKDLKAKKLNIEIDTFLNAYTITDPRVEIAYKYQGIFEIAGRIVVPPSTIRGLPPNTKVYIIRTAHSNSILDIVPVDKVENAL